MPTYDYECAACGHEWEDFQQITERPKRKCPACGRLKARRLLGAGAGIIFRGSGFYQTDYRSKEYKESAKAEKDAASPKKETTPKADTPSDKKPKSQSESK